ncbi:MAG: glycogen/starch/alpha-glucan phosphorylase [Opitutales bacterium]|jgi:starch phosphorylase|nr:glycogen/starch/alpha-glucan phosphorylase [Opitutales bacterium]
MSVSSSKKAKKGTNGFHFNTEDSVEGMKTSILNHLKFTLARDLGSAGARDYWVSTCMAVRDRILERMIATQEKHYEEDARRVYYLSLEYLMGRLLNNNLFNTGLADEARKALSDLGYNLDEIREEEPDMGLGNGGLGRLAACFLDSLASLDYPAIGYGIHYEYGLFRQEFVNGHQVEHPDNWLQFANPWEVVRPEYSMEVRLYGQVETQFDSFGNPHEEWINPQVMVGVPYDIPICGYGAGTVNFLRLWASKSSEEFDLDTFNQGGYVEAVQDKAVSETISKVLYPNDSSESGKELRLVQQYFFVCCSLQDIIRRYKLSHSGWDQFSDKAAIQLNDTHPALAIVELLRILMDEEKLEWDTAMDIIVKTFGYTNHTLLPEALEKWSVPLLQKVLPRHLQLIYDINQWFLDTQVDTKWPNDDKMKVALSIVEEGDVQMIRMAHLSVVGSHSTNGVAALHTELLKKNILKDFFELYPDRFNNKTNGITPRRWLLACNPKLSSLIAEKVGDDWPLDLDKLQKLRPFADDAKFQQRFMEIKRENKVELAAIIRRLCHITVNPDAIFDVQIKRLHEYKRQHLNLLHILTLYYRILHDPEYDMVPRVFIFGAKAAPGYYLAKTIIKAINSVGEVINNDPRVRDRIKVVFLPNYGVSLSEKIIPASDLSEQISTAGKEASGTGNMKLALNGSLTIGTLDGANVEILEEVGEDNIFIFGLTVEQVDALRATGYNPYDYYYRNEELRNVVDWLGSDSFTPNEPGVLASLRHSLLDGGDPFMVMADYKSYVAKQEEVDAAYRNQENWARMAIMNTARVGKFSSDRTIHQYSKEVWDLKPVKVD